MSLNLVANLECPSQTHKQSEVYDCPTLVEGMSIAETSESLRITETNVEVRLNRAKELLQESISGYYHDVEVFHFELLQIPIRVGIGISYAYAKICVRFSVGPATSSSPQTIVLSLLVPLLLMGSASSEKPPNSRKIHLRCQQMRAGHR